MGNRDKENALTFWDSKGNPILHIVSEHDKISSERLLAIDNSIRGFLKLYDIDVDNSSEEMLEVRDLNEC